MNGKLVPTLALVLTILLAIGGSIAATQYTQGNIEARVSENEKSRMELSNILRGIDRRLSNIEGYLRRPNE